MGFKKYLAVLLCLLCLALSACGRPETPDDPGSQDGSDPAQTVAQTAEMRLLYCANDTLNPYKTISKINAEIDQLLFEPLIKYTGEFQTVYALAQTVKTEGNLCTVTLRDAKFSDGSAVTADDVLFSYGLAKKSDRFSYLFYEVTSVSAADGRTVTFGLSKADPYFERLLTFPILKQGTDDLKNEDNVEIIPTGCGRFVYSAEESALLPNEQYYGEKGSVSKIRLINAPDEESVRHYVEIGATDLYYTDLSDDNVIRMSGKRASVNLNNLVYIGVNHSYAPLADEEMLYAISSALDRQALADQAVYGNATPADGFFHPVWEEAKGYQTIQTSADSKIAIENLEKIGYNNLDSEGMRSRADRQKARFTLLVNKDNAVKLAAAQQIAEQLKSVGIELQLTAVGADQYHSLLNSGNYQLYLGEVKLTANMDISPLVLTGGSAAYGIKPSGNDDPADPQNAYVSAINAFYSGSGSITDVASALPAAMPVIPVVYRQGLVFYSDRIADIGDLSISDLFLSFTAYTFQ